MADVEPDRLRRLITACEVLQVWSMMKMLIYKASWFRHATYQPTNLPTYQPNKTIQSKTNQIKPTNQTKQSKLANMHSSQPG
jgi:hypothetical protein